MPFVKWNHPIETFPPCRPDEAFTVRIRLRRTYRRLQHLECHRPQGRVYGRREDAIAIMDEKAIRAIQRQTVPELLDRPFRRGVIGEIPVHDPSAADVEEDEDVQPLKRGRYHDEEVAGRVRRRHDCAGTWPTIGLIGHHCSGAVMACSVAACAATPSAQASRGAPPRCAPHPMSGCDWPSPR